MNTLVLRVVLLATLLFGVNLWTGRHLGVGIREFAIVNSFLGFLAVALSWIDSEDAKSLRERFRSILRAMTNLPVLIAMYIVALIGTSLISSVTVLADGASGPTKVYLAAEGSARCDGCGESLLRGSSDIARYVRPTSVFGRYFYLEADGYQRKSFQLFPWTGATISVTRDLERVPTVLLRIPASLHGSLNGGKMQLDFGDPGGPVEIRTQSGQASVQIGPATIIPELMRSEWRSELRTLPNVPVELHETIYRNWLNPVRSESVPTLASGATLKARFLTAADKEVARQEFVIGRESLQDIVLVPLE